MIQKKERKKEFESAAMLPFSNGGREDESRTYFENRPDKLHARARENEETKQDVKSGKKR